MVFVNQTLTRGFKMAKELSNHAAAAKQVRVWLKSKNIPASVTCESYSMGSSLRVIVTDLNPEDCKMVKEFADQYQYGDFNSMEDIYEYRKNPLNLPRVKYVYVRNEISDELRQKIWDFALAYYVGMEGAPAVAKEAYRFILAGWGMNGDELIYRLMSGGFNNNQFWDAQKVEA